jgi:hypothetical protein
VKKVKRKKTKDVLQVRCNVSLVIFSLWVYENLTTEIKESIIKGHPCLVYFLDHFILFLFFSIKGYFNILETIKRKTVLSFGLTKVRKG